MAEEAGRARQKTALHTGFRLYSAGKSVVKNTGQSTMQSTVHIIVQSAMQSALYNTV